MKSPQEAADRVAYLEEMNTQAPRKGNPRNALDRALVLSQAHDAVMGPREAAYGSPVDNFTRIGEFWTIILDRQVPITPAQVAQMMIALKLARLQGTNHPDAWVDIAGYAACGGEGS